MKKNNITAFVLLVISLVSCSQQMDKESNHLATIDSLRNELRTAKYQLEASKTNEQVQYNEQNQLDSINTDTEIINFITEMYNKRKFEDYTFLKKHCSKEMLNQLNRLHNEMYDPDPEALAVWHFRSSSNGDGFGGTSRILSTEILGDHWYRYVYIDMGIAGITKLKVIKRQGKIDGNIIMEKIEKEFEDHYQFDE